MKGVRTISMFLALWRQSTLKPNLRKSACICGKVLFAVCFPGAFADDEFWAQDLQCAFD